MESAGLLAQRDLKTYPGQGLSPNNPQSKILTGGGGGTKYYSHVMIRNRADDPQCKGSCVSVTRDLIKSVRH